MQLIMHEVSGAGKKQHYVVCNYKCQQMLAISGTILKVFTILKSDVYCLYLLWTHDGK